MAKHNNILTLEEALQTALVIFNNHFFGDSIAKDDLEELGSETISHARDILVEYLDQTDFIEDPWYGMDFTEEELEELQALKENEENE